MEYFDLTLTDEKIAGYNKSTEEVMNNTNKRLSENGKNDLKSIAKEVEVMQLETEKGTEEEYYFYVLVDGEIYKIKTSGAKYIGQRSSEEIELQEGDIEFSYSKTELTNQDVIVTIKTTKDLEGSKIVYRINKNGTEGEWQDYKNTITVSTNCSIDAKITGITGETKTATGEVKNIDKLAPNDFTPTSSKTTNKIIVTSSTEDQEATDDYAMSGEIKYSFKITGTDWSEYQDSGEKTFEKLIQDTPYTIQIKAKDKAGNETEKKLEVKTDAMIGSNDNKITFSGMPKDWTNDDVTITAATTTEYRIQTSLDKTTWTYEKNRTLSTNGTVYARLVDSTEQHAEEGTYATAEVTKIDKENPSITSVKADKVGATEITISAVGSDVARNGSGQSNIKEYRFYQDNDITPKVTQNTGTYTYTGLNEEQDYTFKVVAVDNAGNESSIDASSAKKDIKKVPKTTECIRYFMDLDGNTSNGVDGVVFLDFAFGASGTWYREPSPGSSASQIAIYKQLRNF